MKLDAEDIVHIQLDKMIEKAQELGKRNHEFCESKSEVSELKRKVEHLEDKEHKLNKIREFIKSYEMEAREEGKDYSSFIVKNIKVFL